MSLRPSSAFVVAVLLCSLADPRDRQEVLQAEGIEPHPGPGQQHGIVKHEVETIEERMKRAEDREEGRGGDKKQRCLSPPLAIHVSTASTKISSGEQKGGGKRGKEGSFVNGGGEHKNHKSQETPETPNLPPNAQPQTQKKIKHQNLLSPRKVGENGDEVDNPPSQKQNKNTLQNNGKGAGREGGGGLSKEEEPTNKEKTPSPPRATSPVASPAASKANRSPRGRGRAAKRGMHE